MSGIDYAVLFGTLLAIAIYGWWKTRSDHDLGHYLHGDSSIRWGTIGLSVMATQASAITFLSTPGQAYESGMGFRPKLFRPALCPHRGLRRLHPDLSPAQGGHGV